MCRPHWFALPLPIRQRINETWAAWKATGLWDTAKALDYIEITDEARRWAATQAGRLDEYEPELPRWQRLHALRSERDA